MDKIAIKSGQGGQEAIASLIGDDNQTTKYLSATESFSVVQRLGDPNNYVEFDTKKCRYISMDELLTSSSYNTTRDILKANRKLYRITTQQHGLIVVSLPRSAITRIVINGQEMEP
jgi:hypothetical protein